MKTLQKLKWFILGGIIFAGASVYAVSQPSFTPSLIPISDATYYLGSTSPARKWAGIYMSGSDGCLNLTSGLIGSTGVACGSGGGGSFPFTATANYNSTSTAIGFLSGLFSNSTTTLNGTINFPGITNGCLNITSGVVGSTACGAGAAFPFTNFANYNATTTVIGFNGLFSTASSTFGSDTFFTNLTQGFNYIGSNGRLNTIASSSVKLSWFNNDSAFLSTVSVSAPLGGNGTGGSPITCSTCLTSTFAFPFTSFANYNATGTAIGFQGGLFSTASSTFNNDVFFSNLTGGFAGITTNGRLYTFATSTIKGSQINNDSGWTSNAGTVTGITNGTGLVNNGTTYTTSGTITSGVGTSTNPTIGNLAMWSSTGSSASTATLHSIATSSLSGGGPITVSNNPNIIGASTATLGCTAASVSVNGCLNASDYSKFNSATTTFTFPLTYTTGTNAVTWYGLSTTSALTAGQVIYSSGTNGVSGVATGTVSAGSSAITVTANRYAIGGALAIDCAVASASQAGCISSASFSKHDSATTTFSSPLTYTSGTNAVTCPTCLTTAGADPFSHPFPWTSASTSSFMFGTTTISTNISSTLTLASTTAPQLGLSNGTGFALWDIYNSAGSFYLATTTISGLSTTTLPAFTIASSTGHHGIGSSTPYAMLSVDTSANVVGPAFSIGSSAGIGMIISTTTNDLLYLGTTTPEGQLQIWNAPGALVVSTSSTPQISITDGISTSTTNFRAMGNAFSISTSSTSQSTSTKDIFGYNTNGLITFGNYAACTGTGNFLGLTLTGTIPFVTCDAVASDERLKKDIAPLSGGLSIIRKISPITFFWKDPTDRNTNQSSLIQYGFTAQQIAPILPSAVGTTSANDKEIKYTNGGDIYTLDKTALISPLVSAVQELDTRTNWMILGMILLAVWNILLTIKIKRK